jgi:ABC-type Fe3+ transport system substrate-binding protein
MTDEMLVYATLARAAHVRPLLAAACQATGISARLELYGSGSLFQRLGPRHAPPLPDVVLWAGPFAAHSAALAGLMQPYQPRRVADLAAHHAEWRWTAFDYRAFVGVGPPLGDLTAAASAARLALADPERCEFGLALLLATLDRFRQSEGDPERGWAWWQQRVVRGVALFEDENGARSAVADAVASHAVVLGGEGLALAGLPAVPDVVGVAANARNVEAARRLVDWLVGEDGSEHVQGSVWRAASNGLQAALSAAPALDVAWATQQYIAARRRWAAHGFGPTLPRA